MSKICLKHTLDATFLDCLHRRSVTSQVNYFRNGHVSTLGWDNISPDVKNSGYSCLKGE